jgi:glutamate racemase
LEKIKEFMPQGINIIPQGKYVADSLQNYLHRHPDMQQRLSQNGTLHLLTTEQPSQFNENASIFLNNPVEAQRIILQ